MKVWIDQDLCTGDGICVELAPAIFKELGLPELAIMNADTETNVEVARARAEKLINDGAQLEKTLRDLAAHYPKVSHRRSTGRLGIPSKHGLRSQGFFLANKSS